ncbi:GlsB/YeaQ/YmgE family stress response membrane protein [Bartonella sp. F02]|uniref:GlsB/YeaQ/YmgE family stress response membrane protein n=1 Tax=Bartonella sp. F02 TaxID=2967262 RepID=UPI0022A93441|nr:GlsB/YeaQ/YmgE family stress response membrane protein [Bartonella sp. F02]MCZ2328690.1 GlsB/YeaQ/YmgE family stress response membrane protein [Bartonella sp. F02]
MEDTNIGWIIAIIIGGLAGWAAQYFMKSRAGILLNIVLGVLGAALASFFFGLLGINFAGWFDYLISGFIGACILIWIGRKIRP